MSEPSAHVLRTRDGVRLVADHWSVVDRRLGCVVAHGFTGRARNADVSRIVAGLLAHGIGVLAPDLRGHGRSSGLSTAGADEIHDIAAAVHWLRGAGYAQVAVVGFSMGGTAALRHAGLGGDADAVVSVSAPATMSERGTRPMRLVHWMFEKRAGRATVRIVRRTRVSAQPWATPPENAADVVGAIAPRPLLLVHGDADRYFPMTHLDALAAAAPTATVWVEAGMGHAELASTDELVGRIGTWLRTTVEAAGTAPPATVCHDDGRD